MATEDQASLLRDQADAIVGVGPYGDVIEYRSDPEPVFKATNAIKFRPTVDVDGTVVANRLRVFVSRSEVPRVNVGRDEIRVASETEGEPGRIYKVSAILSEGPGFFLLLGIGIG